MISLYISQPSWLHRWPAGIKLALLAVVSITVLPVSDWRWLFAGLIITALLMASLGPAGRSRLWGLRKLLPLVLGIGVFQAIVMTWEAGLVSVLRIMLMVAAADLVTATTPMQALMNAMLPLLKPFTWVGINSKRIALAVALAVRLIPLLFAQWDAQREAWSARSKRRAGLYLLSPFMTQTLRRTDHLAEALASRRIHGTRAAPLSKGFIE
jgi:biotin transport system permease protein